MKLQFHTDNEDIIESVTSFVNDWDGSLPYFEVKTSGSTGTPKTIRITKDYARASAKMTCEFLELKSGASALLCLSHETIGGKMMIIRAMEQNLDLHVVAPSANPLSDLHQDIDFVAMVPYQMQRVLSESPNNLKKNMKIILGGGPVTATLEKQICSVPSQVYHTFGMTETISHIALRDISAHESAFKALPGVSIRETHGRLQISAPQLGVDQLITNDCIEMKDGDSFEWLGRADFAVNSGGVKIHPEEVERRISSIIEKPFFVIGVPDNELGERLVLCVQSEPFLITKSEISAVLPKYHVPKQVFFYSTFVYTKSDKINRRATLAAEILHEATLL